MDSSKTVKRLMGWSMPSKISGQYQVLEHLSDFDFGTGEKGCGSGFPSSKRKYLFRPAPTSKSICGKTETVVYAVSDYHGG